MNDKNVSRLEKYQKEFDSDVEVNMQNIRLKSSTVSSIRSKWIRYHFIEKQLLDKLRNTKNIYSKQLVKNISAKANVKFASIGVNVDPKLEKLNKAIKQTEYCLEFIDRAFNVLETFNFQIKNTIELIKLDLM